MLLTKIAKLTVLSLFITNVAFCDCDWSKIKDNGDSTYTYSKELNVCVGNLVRDSKVKDQQIGDLKQAITLKDLALTKADSRAQLWQDTSMKLEDRMIKIDDLQKSNQWLFFGLGVITTVGAGMLAAKAIK